MGFVQLVGSHGFKVFGLRFLLPGPMGRRSSVGLVDPTMLTALDNVGLVEVAVCATPLDFFFVCVCV